MFVLLCSWKEIRQSYHIRVKFLALSLSKIYHVYFMDIFSIKPLCKIINTLSSLTYQTSIHHLLQIPLIISSFRYFILSVCVIDSITKHINTIIMYLIRIYNWICSYLVFFISSKKNNWATRTKLLNVNTLEITFWYLQDTSNNTLNLTIIIVLENMIVCLG